MKRRQYAIIIEEGNFQEVREVNTIEDVVDIIHEYTYGMFWYEEDDLPKECIDTKNFKGLKEYLLFLNKNNHQYIEIYCDSLDKINRIKHLRQLRTVVKNLNKVLIGMNSGVEIYLNSRKYDGYSWCD